MLFLKSFEFSDYFPQKKPFEEPQSVWELQDLILNDKVNLIVGKNATGKTKTLKEIIRLAALIKTGQITSNNYSLRAVFNQINPKNKEYISYQYELEIIERKITKEQLIAKYKKNKSYAERELIVREKDDCTIHEEYSGTPTKIRPPVSSLAIANRDLLKYPYLDDLYQWAFSVNAYSFGSLKDTYTPVPFFNFPVTFEISGVTIPEMYKEIIANKDLEQKILSNLKKIDYHIQQILVAEAPIKEKNDIFTIFLEKGLKNPLLITDISAGMNRAFHTIVVMEYFLNKQNPTTLIIDDVGEGLDYKRSSELIKLLINKVENSDIQLIITSNDRFLMNIVDLKYWNILYRNKTLVKAYNYDNNKKKFDNFMDIGISNFNYFSDFYEEIEDAD